MMHLSMNVNWRAQLFALRNLRGVEQGEKSSTMQYRATEGIPNSGDESERFRHTTVEEGDMRCFSQFLDGCLGLRMVFLGTSWSSPSRTRRARWKPTLSQEFLFMDIFFRDAEVDFWTVSPVVCFESMLSIRRELISEKRSKHLFETVVNKVSKKEVDPIYTRFRYPNITLGKYIRVIPISRFLFRSKQRRRV